MVRIRLRRVGAKKQPSYRIVVADSRSPRDGRFIENIGHYNPRTEPATMWVKEERALHWLSVGAQPSDTVLYILKTLGTMGRLERLRAGEPLEVLLAEADAEAEARPTVDPRTRRPAKPRKKEKEAVPQVIEGSAPAQATEAVKENAAAQVAEAVEESAPAEEPEVQED